MSKKVILIIFVAAFYIHFTQAQAESSIKYNKFLDYIFKKYGSKGVITFEGLEHLMHNLGLGGLEFPQTHTIFEHRFAGFEIPELEIDEQIKHSSEEEIQRHKDENEAEASDNNEDSEETEDEKDDDDTEVDNQINKANEIEEDRELKSEFWQTIDFKEFHDPKHRHPRHHGYGSSISQCMSPVSIVNLIYDGKIKRNPHQKHINYKIDSPSLHDDLNFDNSEHYRNTRSIGKTDHVDSDKDQDEELDIEVSSVKITPSAFLHICPTLLLQLDQKSCANQMAKHIDLREEGSLQSAWLYATVSVLIISLCGLSGVAVVPLAKSLAYQELLRFLVALAVGTLCGDALMHLLPHALAPHVDHGNSNLPEPDHGHVSDLPVYLCGCAFLSALLMYILETGLPLLNGGQKHTHSHHGHAHGHHHSHNEPENLNLQSVKTTNQVIPIDDSDLDVKTNPEAKELGSMLDESKTNSSKLSPVAFMVILGDGLHNITDGLAIGAAFALDPITGMATALAVLCHELPHELGDFALLLQTGVNIRKALFLNVVSSILSFIGMAVGLLIASVHTSLVRWIYAATAGSFLYIALADLIPEMGKGVRTFKSFLVQVFGISLGGLIMLSIALNEDRLRILFE